MHGCIYFKKLPRCGWEVRLRRSLLGLKGKFRCAPAIPGSGSPLLLRMRTTWEFKKPHVQAPPSTNSRVFQHQFSHPLTPPDCPTVQFSSDSNGRQTPQLPLDCLHPRQVSGTAVLGACTSVLLATNLGAPTVLPPIG